MDDETLQRWLDDVPFHGQLGRMTVERTDEGVELRATLLPSAGNASDSAVAHGGVAATLLDSALTFALIAATDRDWSTVDLRVDYLRPVGIGDVMTSARAIHAGRRVGRAEGELRDAAGAVCARAVGTFVPAE
ncbi:MAG: PaaI family thioesterase [Planctomycetaceae bacterium]